MVKNRTLLSNKVSKLGVNLPTFNIPKYRTICIGKTDYCDRVCYGNKHHFCFKNIKNKLQWNYLQSKKDSFEDRIIAEITVQHFSSINRFRIHSMGDFYSQEYLNSWYKIIGKFPNIQFVAYTKSYQLEFIGKPKNLELFYSIDETTKHYPKHYKELFRMAYTVEPKFYKPMLVSNAIGCSKKCHSCKVCYTRSDKTVIFKRH